MHTVTWLSHLSAQLLLLTGGQLFKQAFNTGFQFNSSFRLENNNSDEKEKLAQHNPKVFEAFIE